MFQQGGEPQQRGGPPGQQRRGDYNSQRPRHPLTTLSHLHCLHLKPPDPLPSHQLQPHAYIPMSSPCALLLHSPTHPPSLSFILPVCGMPFEQCSTESSICRLASLVQGSWPRLQGRSPAPIPEAPGSAGMWKRLPQEPTAAHDFQPASVPARERTTGWASKQGATGLVVFCQKPARSANIF